MLVYISLKELAGMQLTLNFFILFFSDLVFEKAYCQYRLNQPQEALKTLNSLSQLSLKLKELKAQILYRLERYV